MVSDLIAFETKGESGMKRRFPDVCLVKKKEKKRKVQRFRVWAGIWWHIRLMYFAHYSD
jgi:hypothetical protein